MKDNYTRYPRAILWLIRGGIAEIGGDDDESQPSFHITVESFYLSKLPVTNRQFEAFRPQFRRATETPGDDDPATGLCYEDARGYCEWYAGVSRKPMRLPTEVEWEYACRGGSSTPRFCGASETAVDEFIRHSGNSGAQVPPLNRLRTNPFGLQAMLGGVWEWTGSLHLPYPAIAGDGRDEPAAAGERVLRGGSFRTPLERIGSGVRRAGDPDQRAGDFGFRVARSL